MSCGSYGTSGMTRGRLVHLLLEHPLVDRAHRVLRPAEDLRSHPLGLTERELRDGVADPTLDPLRPESDLVIALALPPLLRAVRVPDGHAHHRDRRMHAAERHHSGNPAPGSDDDLATDLLAQDAVRGAHVARPLGSDRRRLQAEAVLANRSGSVVHHGVRRRAATLERKIEADELELDSDDLRRERAQCLLEELLPGLVAFEDRDGQHGLDPTDGSASVMTEILSVCAFAQAFLGLALESTMRRRRN